ncbi:MAG TPA: hypothetical protein VF211_01220 [Burkholderiales bacterium]
MNLFFGLMKQAADPQGDRLLAREAQWLRSLEDVPELDGQLPRVLDEGVTRPEGRRFLVVSMVPPNGETRAFTAEHARFLASLGKARFRAIDFEVSGTCRWLLRALTELEGFAAPHAVSALGDAYHDCETALLYWTGPYVLAQGDFAPWHIRCLGSQLFVTEWGNARAEASPLDDVLHYLMIQRALSRRPLSVPALESAMRQAREFAVRAYPEWSWRPRVIGALTLVYLLGTLLHRALAARRVDLADPVVAGYWRLLEKRAAWMPSQD